MFISLVTNVDPERVRTIKELLNLHEQQRIEIVVSTMAIVEFRPYQAGMSIDAAAAKAVDDLFNSTDILLYSLTPDIALMAREIGEKHPSINPTDSIHIATAIVAKADVLFTFDGGGKKRRPRHMIANTGRIGTPPLKISEPFVDFGPLIDGPS